MADDAEVGDAEASFRVSCVDTRMGQHVRVVGSCAALGMWSPMAGLPLYTSAAEFPAWLSADVASTPPLGEGNARAASARLPPKETFEYKYVICSDNGQPVRWEERPNRSANFAVLKARGVLQGTGRVFVTEAFNAPDEPDGNRFFMYSTPTGRTVSKPSYVRRNSEANVAPGMHGFERTVRERSNSTVQERSTSISKLGSIPMMERNPSIGQAPSQRSASRSYLRLPDPDDGDAHASLEPEVVGPTSPVRNASVPEVVEGGLMREESCSALFLDDVEVGETAIQQEFQDHYDFLGTGPLGEGTFGLVWRCVPKSANQVASVGGTGEALSTDGHVDERAAKIVRKARLQPHDMRYLLGEDGEVQTHLTMKHPHIVELYEYFDEPLSVTLVLEYCRGGDLFDAIVSQRKTGGRGLSEQAAARVTQHVMSALKYMHGLRVVHRDIKCENVLLCRVHVPVEQNVFKLCDFGFAAHDKGQGLCDRLGSPDTVAPEVVIGARYGAPVDIWSTGVLLYMMLSATPPFYAATDGEVLKRVRNGNYSLNAGIWDTISSPAKKLIASLLTMDPTHRPEAAEALQSDFIQNSSHAASA